MTQRQRAQQQQQQSARAATTVGYYMTMSDDPRLGPRTATAAGTVTANGGTVTGAGADDKDTKSLASAMAFIRRGGRADYANLVAALNHRARTANNPALASAAAARQRRGRGEGDGGAVWSDHDGADGEGDGGEYDYDGAHRHGYGEDEEDDRLDVAAAERAAVRAPFDPTQPPSARSGSDADASAGGAIPPTPVTPAQAAISATALAATASLAADAAAMHRVWEGWELRAAQRIAPANPAAVAAATAAAAAAAAAAVPGSGSGSRPGTASAAATSAVVAAPSSGGGGSGGELPSLGLMARMTAALNAGPRASTATPTAADGAEASPTVPEKDKPEDDDEDDRDNREDCADWYDNNTADNSAATSRPSSVLGSATPALTGPATSVTAVVRAGFASAPAPAGPVLGGSTATGAAWAMHRRGTRAPLNTGGDSEGNSGWANAAIKAEDATDDAADAATASAAAAGQIRMFRTPLESRVPIVAAADAPGNVDIFPSFDGLRDFSDVNAHLKLTPLQPSQVITQDAFALLPAPGFLVPSPWLLPLLPAPPADLHKELCFSDGFDYSYAVKLRADAVQRVQLANQRPPAADSFLAALTDPDAADAGPLSSLPHQTLARLLLGPAGAPVFTASSLPAGAVAAAPSSAALAASLRIGLALSLGPGEAQSCLFFADTLSSSVAYRPLAQYPFDVRELPRPGSKAAAAAARAAQASAHRSQTQGGGAARGGAGSGGSGAGGNATGAGAVASVTRMAPGGGVITLGIPPLSRATAAGSGYSPSLEILLGLASAHSTAAQPGAGSGAGAVGSDGTALTTAGRLSVYVRPHHCGFVRTTAVALTALFRTLAAAAARAGGSADEPSTVPAAVIAALIPDLVRPPTRAPGQQARRRRGTVTGALAKARAAAAGAGAAGKPSRDKAGKGRADADGGRSGSDDDDGDEGEGGRKGRRGGKGEGARGGDWGNTERRHGAEAAEARRQRGAAAERANTDGKEAERKQRAAEARKAAQQQNERRLREAAAAKSATGKGRGKSGDGSSGRRGAKHGDGADSESAPSGDDDGVDAHGDDTPHTRHGRSGLSVISERDSLSDSKSDTSPAAGAAAAGAAGVETAAGGRSGAASTAAGGATDGPSTRTGSRGDLDSAGRFRGGDWDSDSDSPDARRGRRADRERGGGRRGDWLVDDGFLRTSSSDDGGGDSRSDDGAASDDGGVGSPHRRRRRGRKWSARRSSAREAAAMLARAAATAIGGRAAEAGDAEVTARRRRRGDGSDGDDGADCEQLVVTRGRTEAAPLYHGLVTPWSSAMHGASTATGALVAADRLGVLAADDDAASDGDGSDDGLTPEERRAAAEAASRASAAAAEAESAFKSTLLDRLQRVWDFFATPVEERLACVAKFSLSAFAPLLSGALEAWEHCADVVLLRRALLRQAETLDARLRAPPASAPTPAAATAAAEERRAAGAGLAQAIGALVTVTSAMRRLLLSLFALYREALTVDGERYAVTMRRDHEWYAELCGRQPAMAPFAPVVPLEDWTIWYPGEQGFDLAAVRALLATLFPNYRCGDDCTLTLPEPSREDRDLALEGFELPPSPVQGEYDDEADAEAEAAWRAARRRALEDVPDSTVPDDPEADVGSNQYRRRRTTRGTARGLGTTVAAAHDPAAVAAALRGMRDGVVAALGPAADLLLRFGDQGRAPAASGLMLLPLAGKGGAVAGEAEGGRGADSAELGYNAQFNSDALDAAGYHAPGSAGARGALGLTGTSRRGRRPGTGAGLSAPAVNAVLGASNGSLYAYDYAIVPARPLTAAVAGGITEPLLPPAHLTLFARFPAATRAAAGPALPRTRVGPNGELIVERAAVPASTGLLPSVPGRFLPLRAPHPAPTNGALAVALGPTDQARLARLLQLQWGWERQRRSLDLLRAALDEGLQRVEQQQAAAEARARERATRAAAAASGRVTGTAIGARGTAVAAHLATLAATATAGAVDTRAQTARVVGTNGVGDARWVAVEATAPAIAIITPGQYAQHVAKRDAAEAAAAASQQHAALGRNNTARGNVRRVATAARTAGLALVNSMPAGSAQSSTLAAGATATDKGIAAKDVQTLSTAQLSALALRKYMMNM